MSESSSRAGRPARPSAPGTPSKYVDFFLYASAAVTYVTLSIYNKWLLDWIVGPLWLVAWVWGLPALVKLARRQPIRPQRPPVGDPE
ncbi:MAG TPA: hypothetical protein VGP92_04020 [Acidimicrobiia bacterium]|nr:hypothetical protein [Acidimicrobiia bacterium]